MSREITESTLIPGRATSEGTQRFAARHASTEADSRAQEVAAAESPAPVSSDHFARPDTLALSSIALGTIRGEPGGVDDLLYRSVVGDFIEAAGNVLNSALSDRMQTSERAIGRALGRLFHEQSVTRDEIVVVTKGGALTPDPDNATSYTAVQRDLVSTYIDSGLLDPTEIIRGHSMAPKFLLDQIQRSRRNLGLETLDYYLIQEPEIWLRKLGPDAFRAALTIAFLAMEEAVSRGWIGAYGVSTWDGLLLPDSDRSHLSIVDLFEVALDVGQADHHFRALQLPYGLAMGEGAVLESQLGPDGHSRAILDSLRDTGTVIFASAPLYGGRLIGQIPRFVREAFPEAPSDATTALQFVRSTAGITTAVVGMREQAHVLDNLYLARVPRADPSLPGRLFAAAAREASAQA